MQNKDCIKYYHQAIFPIRQEGLCVRVCCLVVFVFVFVFVFVCLCVFIVIVFGGGDGS